MIHVIQKIVLLLSIILMLIACTPGGEVVLPKSPDVSITARNSSVDLSWSISEDAEYYNIYYSKNQSDLKKVGFQLQTKSNGIQIENLENDTTYYFTVTSVSEIGESEVDSILHVKPLPPTNPPTNVKLTPGNESVKIEWENIESATSYNIYLARVGDISIDNINSLSGWMIIKNATNPYIQTGLVNGVEYHVVVTAINDGGESKESIEKSVFSSISLNVEVGEGHVCAILADKSLWCWGNNESGQVGDNTFTNRFKPTKLAQEILWDQVSMGEKHTCGIDSVKEIWCWGMDVYGSEFGRFKEVNQPVKIESAKTWNDVFLNRDTICAHKNDEIQSIVCWGSRDHLPDIENFQLMKNKGNYSANSFALGGSDSCLIDVHSDLWCWGPEERLIPNFANNLGLYYGLVSNNWKSIAASSIFALRPDSTDSTSHLCGIKNDGRLWCWGDNVNGQLGIETGAFEKNPKIVSEEFKWQSVTLGNSFSCGIQIDHSLWCWGSNEFGQLGLDTDSDVKTPTKIGNDNDWRDVSAYSNTTCASKLNGDIYCTGLNNYGQLGTGEDSFQSTPVKILSNIDTFSLALNSACSKTKSSDVFCWGKKIEKGYSRKSPFQIYEKKSIKKIHMGDNKGCVLTDVGEISCWDHLDISYLKNYQHTMDGWNDLSISNQYMCAISSIDVSLWCVKDPKVLGPDENSEKEYISLHLVDDAHEWSSISIIDDYGCAIDVNNSLYCWGGNDRYGTLGVGDYQDRENPELVSGTNKWLTVSTGARHACGLTTNQKIGCWGDNSFGQLGQPEILWSNIPLLIHDEDNWLSVSVRGVRTCAVKADFTLWCWGLPLSNNDNFVVPEKQTIHYKKKNIGPESDWIEVGLGAQFICAKKINNDLYCWGGNRLGEIGNGKAWRSSWEKVEFSPINSF